MNKPAPKEPSMDEILSSIRQIIADDDAGTPSRRASFQAVPDPMEPTPAQPFSAEASGSADRDLSDMLEDIEPLALSATQIVPDADNDENDSDTGGISFDSLLADTDADRGQDSGSSTPMVDPNDVGFDLADEAEEEELPSFNPEISFVPQAKAEPEPVRIPSFSQPPAAAVSQPRPQPTIAQAAPMPDPDLTKDLADQLIEPATNAAVRSSLTKLNGLGLGNASTMTIETLMKDLLRPMLKEWLDENLPSVVERMVEREIARISRGE